MIRYMAGGISLGLLLRSRRMEPCLPASSSRRERWSASTDAGGVRRITVEAPGIAARLREGDSLGVSGVCLTALDVDPTYFHADLAQETLDRTSLGALAAGAKVNLELPTAAGSPLGGHIVQGHVDGTGVIDCAGAGDRREPARSLTSRRRTGR